MSITTGKKKGAILSKMAAITAPLITLPYRRMAKDTPRENSPIILNGNIINEGSINLCKYWRTPPLAMPNSGIATNTEMVSATVVDSDEVGGAKPGTTVSTLDTAINKNKVPAKYITCRAPLCVTSAICD